MKRELELFYAKVDLKLASLRDGKDGKDGAPGKDGATGPAGIPGKDGVVTHKEAATKGIWKEGETYTPGDIVGSAGSGWMCNAETKDKPGTSEAWTLFIKRGRDGKDGKDGMSVEATQEQVETAVRKIMLELVNKGYFKNA